MSAHAAIILGSKLHQHAAGLLPLVLRPRLRLRLRLRPRRPGGLAS